MGCDEGILLSDRAFAGSDTWATAYTLAQAIKQMDACDLVICGERATDGETGQVGPGVASFLNLPVVTFVGHIDASSRDGLELRRLVEGGEEVVWAPMPVVLTVVKEIASPRLPTLRGKQRAKRTEVPTWGPEEIDANDEWLGLHGSPTRVVKIDKPRVARQGELIRAKDPEGVEEAASRIIDFLRERRFIGQQV